MDQTTLGSVSVKIKMCASWLLSFSLVACAPMAGSGPPASLNGIWVSEGYGYALAIDEGKLRFFHVTPTVCVESDEPDLRLDDVFDRRRLRPDGLLFLSTSREPYEFVFRRTGALPEVCLGQGGSDRQRVVDTFVSYLQTHYSFFSERGVEPGQALAQFRLEAGRASGEGELFDAMTNLLSRTRDAHVELRGEVDGAERRFDADPGLIRRRAEELAKRTEQSPRDVRAAFHDDFWVQSLGEELLGGKGGHAGNDRIRWGMVAPGVGYLALRSMGGFLPASPAAQTTEQEVLDAALDRAIALFDQERARAVVLDLSINSGGYDYIARRLASRLSGFTGFAYERFARDAPQPFPFRVEVAPEGSSQFIGPVYVLTSRETVSAAELAVMILRADPQTVHVGETTRGALSTKLAKPLPNGWVLTLANEVYRDHLGTVWEARGIPPHREILLFPSSDQPEDDVAPLDLSSPHRQAIKRLVDMIREDLEPK